MSLPFSMPATFPPVQVLAPATDAAGRTSNYFSLKNCLKAWIVFEVTQGNAATIVLSPLQAQDVSGTGSKAVNAVPIWTDADETTTDALVLQGAAATFTTDAGVKNKIVVFEIDPARTLDMANGFDCIGFSTGASNAANITAAQLYIYGRYQQATPPSATSN